MKGLGKTDEVIELLRRLPYIECKPYSTHPEVFSGALPINWMYVARELQTGETHPESELLMSEGYEDQFEGKIPAYCIGLVHGGYMLDNEEPDVILLDTKSGVIRWMDCPQCIRKSASPKPSYLIYETEEREQVGEVDEEQNDEDKEEEEQEKEEEDEEEEEDSDGDEEEIRWGPCWPVRHFFEMLKNQYRQLNFMARDENKVVDIWTKSSDIEGPIPDGFINHLQAIYRKHGWPDLSKYKKEECLAELKRELEEKFPGNHMYYFRDGC